MVMVEVDDIVTLKHIKFCIIVGHGRLVSNFI